MFKKTTKFFFRNLAYNSQFGKTVAVLNLQIYRNFCMPKGLALSGEKDLDDQITKWLQWDKNPKTHEEIIKAVCKKDWKNLRARLCTRIVFGTAGLRAKMQAGFDSMNDLIIVQTAQGICAYVMQVYPDKAQHSKQGVVFGYDGRYNSKRFAEISAAVFLAAGFKVYLFGRMVATPFVPFAITHYKCLAGVMVTASHNPKLDNGYKMYWTNAAQIIPPIDKDIYESILKNLEPKASSWKTEDIYKNSQFSDPYDEVVPKYYEALLKMIPAEHLKSNQSCSLQFVYTPLHGVGFNYIEQAFCSAKLKPVIAVKAQRDPDPEFPTVDFPNPEEGKSALDLSLKLANEHDVGIILANDPDADRLAIAVRESKNKWKILSGDELGALSAWWAVENYKARTGASDLSKCAMIASTVSSKIIASMAKIECFTFEETLTGFKWMGNKAIELQKQGKVVLLAYEESIGYMFGTNVLDKDGVSAATHLATMACYLQNTRGLSLLGKLCEIYDTYGLHTTNNSYFICHEQETIKRLFERLRTYDGGKKGTYPKSILNGEFEIKHVRDLTTGYDDTYPDKKARLPVSASTQMITFTFTNGMVVTMRTSGTEPKIKYYAEFCGKPEDKNWEELKKTLKRMVAAVVEEFLQPKVNKLEPKKD